MDAKQFIIFGLACTLGVTVVIATISRRKRLRQFRQTHPPMSDEQFLVAMADQSTHGELILELRRVIAKTAGGLLSEEIYPTDMVNDLLCLGDGTDLIEIWMAIEAELHIELDLSRVESMLAQIVDFNAIVLADFIGAICRNWDQITTTKLAK